LPVCWRFPSFIGRGFPKAGGWRLLEREVGEGMGEGGERERERERGQSFEDACVVITIPTNSERGNMKRRRERGETRENGFRDRKGESVDRGRSFQLLRRVRKIIVH